MSDTPKTENSVAKAPLYEWLKLEIKLPEKRGWYCCREMIGDGWWYSSQYWNGYAFEGAEDIEFTEWLSEFITP